MDDQLKEVIKMRNRIYQRVTMLHAVLIEARIELVKLAGPFAASSSAGAVIRKIDGALGHTQRLEDES